MVIRPLTAADFEAVHAAFNEAFSDYLVPLMLTREQLEAAGAARVVRQLEMARNLSC